MPTDKSLTRSTAKTRQVLSVELDEVASSACTGHMDQGGGGKSGEGLSMACTLGPVDGKSRMQRWKRLHERAAPIARISGHRLEVCYQPGAGVQEELAELAAAESTCCAFVSWSVTSVDGQPMLRVTAPAESPDALAPIAEMFGASEHVRVT